MNASLRTAVLSLSVLGLAACASTREKSDTTFVPLQRTPSSLDADDVYIAQVERIARRRGIEVIWVHLPRRQLLAQTDK